MEQRPVLGVVTLRFLTLLGLKEQGGITRIREGDFLTSGEITAGRHIAKRRIAGEGAGRQLLTGRGLAGHIARGQGLSGIGGHTTGLGLSIGGIGGQGVKRDLPVSGNVLLLFAGSGLRELTDVFLFGGLGRNLGLHGLFIRYYGFLSGHPWHRSRSSSRAGASQSPGLKCRPKSLFHQDDRAAVG